MNKEFIQVIEKNRGKIIEKCKEVFKESLLTDYSDIWLQTDVAIHKDGEVYSYEHTGNSTDSEVFRGDAKIVYSITEQNIFEDEDLSEDEDLEELKNDIMEHMMEKEYERIQNCIDMLLWELKEYQ